MRWPTLTLRSACLVSICAGVLWSGCRAESLWFGAESTGDGALKIASEEPTCGCLTLASQSNQEMYLRSFQRGASLGGATLHANETRQFKFDWVGVRNDDVYLIEATGATGQALSLDEVVRHEARPVDCDSTQCVYGTLLMNVAQDPAP